MRPSETMITTTCFHYTAFHRVASHRLLGSETHPKDRVVAQLETVYT